MKVLFLTAALALPAWGRDKELRVLEQMIQTYYPNHDVILVHRDERLVSTTDLHTPYVFKGLKVYLRKSA